MAASGESIPIVVGKVYLMGLDFPKVLDTDSPLVRLVEQSGWRTMDSRCYTRTNIVNIHRRFGVVIRYDNWSHVAVVLVGTRDPRQHGHRYVPWLGTPRKPFQTSEVLVPTPRMAFQSRPGYLNFTHAIRVRVLQGGELNNINRVPGQSYFVGIPPRGPAQDIRISLEEMDKLRKLHQDYWAGIRYQENDDSGDSDGDDEDDGNAPTEGKDGLVEKLSKLSVGHTEGERTESDPSEDFQNDPIDPHSGLKCSTIVQMASEEEDFRRLMFTLLSELEEDISFPSPPVYCYLDEIPDHDVDTEVTVEVMTMADL